MKLMYTWARLLPLLLFSLLAIPTDALPKRKSPSGEASSGATTGAAAGATTEGATGAGAGKITTATDGSTILDKTVTIKYSCPPLFPHFQKLFTNNNHPAVSQSATRSPRPPTNSPPPPA